MSSLKSRQISPNLAKKIGQNNMYGETMEGRYFEHASLAADFWEIRGK